MLRAAGKQGNIYVSNIVSSSCGHFAPWSDRSRLDRSQPKSCRSQTSHTFLTLKERGIFYLCHRLKKEIYGLFPALKVTVTEPVNYLILAYLSAAWRSIAEHLYP